MTNLLLVHSKEEASAFADKFHREITVLIQTRTIDGVSAGLNEQMIMQKVLLWNAGYMEAMRKSGMEIVYSLGKLRPSMEYLLHRETLEEIYEWYTDGFNFGIQTSDEHRMETTERMERMFASMEGAAADTIGEHVHREEKTEAKP